MKWLKTSIHSNTSGKTFRRGVIEAQNKVF